MLYVKGLFLLLRLFNLLCVLTTARSREDWIEGFYCAEVIHYWALSNTHRGDSISFSVSQYRIYWQYRI